MNTSNPFGSGISYALLAIAALGFCGAAVADESAVEFEIAAQELGAALNEFALQSGKEILYVAAETEGKSAPSISGRFEPSVALDMLLADAELDYQVNELDTVLVGVAANERGDSDSKNLRPRPVMMAQAMGGQTQRSTTSGSLNDEDATSVVSGQVTDARTGTNLKGALVKIDETEQTTSTDTLGSFRFSSVAPGSYTLRISYLGYQEVVTMIDVRPGSAVERSFAMTGGDELEEILVYGTRSARAQSLNLERTSEVSSTVLSADLLGNFNGTTISESLRRAPGVAFVPSEETGDGANIIVRGLEPDLNQITLNGLRLPEGSGIGRSADLSGLLTESIESVTINKTLLPSHDSNGAGALVEIETKSPLDRPKRFANLGIEYGERGNDFGDDLLATATVSGIFGSEEEFGASLSVQYRDRSVTNLTYSSSVSDTVQYLPADVTNPFGIDPRRLFPYEEGVDEIYPTATTVSSSSIVDENLSITGSLQKQVSDHSDLRLDVTHGVVETENYSTTAGFFALFQGYVLQPIAELGGEQRLAYISEDYYEEAFGAPLFPGVNSGVLRGATWTPKRESKTTTISLRGNTELDRFVFDYTLGYARGSSETPFSGSVGLRSYRGSDFNTPIDFLTDEIRNNTVNGLIVSSFAPLVSNSLEFILPGLTQEGFDFFGDIDNVPIDISNDSTTGRFGASGENERLSVSGSARRDFEASPMRYLEAGLFYEDSEFTSLLRSALDTYSPVGGATSSELGLGFDAPLLSRVGVSGGFPGLSRTSVEQFLQNVDALSAAGLLNISSADDRERLTAGTNEQNFAAYLQARMDIGKLEIIGGARIDRTEIESTFFVSPSFRDETGFFDPTYRDRFGQTVTSSVSQTDVLPRLITNYRLSDTMIFRAGYFSTASRPQVQNLTQPGKAASLDLRLRYGPNGDQPRLFLGQGNPDLKPAFTDNFDMSWEWYHDAVGVMKVSGFYKVIKNSLTATFEDGGLEILPATTVLPDTPEFNNLPDNVFVSVRTPVNSDTNDKIWGAEIALERQLTFLPGFWSGFGFYGNYTYADSSRDVELFNGAGAGSTFILKNVPFSGSPKHSGTASLTYNKYGFDASLTWTTQARRLASLGQNGLDNFAESIETLDFRAEYITETNLRLYLQARDLLTGENDTYLRNSIGGESGVPKYFTGASYFGGRSFSVGVAASF